MSEQITVRYLLIAGRIIKNVSAVKACMGKARENFSRKLKKEAKNGFPKAYYSTKK